MKKRSKLTLWATSLCVMLLIVGLAACAPGNNAPASTASGESAAPQQQVDYETPEPDIFGVITAEQWADIYPHVYASYMENVHNAPGAEKHDYLEMYPALHTLYAGNAFSKGYDEASSHLYSLQSVTSTPRINEKTTAGCFACKTPQFTNMVNTEGEDTYRKSFAELATQITEPISCFSCHANDPTEIVVGNQFFVNAMGNDTKNAPLESQSCGQCHNEYYFVDGVPTNPYTGLDQMTPESMLAYYDERDYSDWLYPGTDSPMLKVQHPEFETIYGGEQTSMARLGYSCGDCHMGPATAEDDTEYTSHVWQSPLENKQLLESTCSPCHADLESQVRTWQDKSEARVHSLSTELESMVKLMVEQVESGALTGDKLTQVQKLHRAAQWYWDFVMVENSEGAHNPALSDKTLDKAEAAINEAMELMQG